MLDSRPKGRGFEPHRRHCVVSLSKNINPSLVLVQPRKTLPFITERLLMGRKESNQTNKQNIVGILPKKTLSICMLGNFSSFCCHLLAFKKNRNTIRVSVWIQIRTDILSVIIWVQTVCKGYQLKAATSKKRVNKHTSMLKALSRRQFEK